MKPSKLFKNIFRKTKTFNAKSELKEIMKETEKEENVLIEQSKKFEEKIEDRLVKAQKNKRKCKKWNGYCST